VSHEPLPLFVFLDEITVAELDAMGLHEIEQLKASIETFDERAAIQAEASDDGKTTTQRALAALQRSERFRGEHDCARVWLREYAPYAGAFSRVRE